MRQTALALIVLVPFLAVASCGEETPSDPVGEAGQPAEAGPASEAGQPAEPAPGATAETEAPPQPVIDSVDTDRFDAATAAAASMKERFSAADPAGQPPRASDPAVAADLAALFDDAYMASLPALPIDNTGPLREWTTDASEVGLLYLLWGTGKADANELAGDQAALASVNANTATYRDELGPYFDFSLEATAAIARASSAHADTLTPAEREQENVQRGLAQVFGGFAQTITGVIGLTTVPGLPEDWLLERLAAVKSIRPTASRVLPARMWRQLTDKASAIGASHTSPAISWELNSLGN